jgi:hypothetical protein
VAHAQKFLNRSRACQLWKRNRIVFLGCCCCCCCCFLFFFSFFQNLISFRFGRCALESQTGTDTKRLTRSRQFQMSRNARAADDDRDQEFPTDRIFCVCFKGSGRIKKKTKNDCGNHEVTNRSDKNSPMCDNCGTIICISVPRAVRPKLFHVTQKSPLLFFVLNFKGIQKINVTCPLNSFALIVNSCKNGKSGWRGEPPETIDDFHTK